jgi:hypothetical protein
LCEDFGVRLARAADNLEAASHRSLPPAGHSAAAA